MHLRRAVLLFAIVLGLTAIASSVAPPPREATRDDTPATTAAPPPRPAPATPPQTIAFAYPSAGTRPRSTAVDDGRHAVVTVRTTTPGLASIPRLGLTDDAEPSTPASFDVLLRQPGRHDVMFQPVGGQPTRLGTLVVRE